MSLLKIHLKPDDETFIRDGNDSFGCGTINNDGHLYLIDENKREAFLLPDKYKDTPIILYHPCGGYQEGLIMVSLLGEIRLQYYHTFHDTAGMWGWIDLEGNEVISPQYVYAMSFYNGQAIVCKGSWTIDDCNRYWCNDEAWGVIDKTGKEIVPCGYDEIFEVSNTDRFFLCHKGGWENGCNCIYDADAGEELFDLDFSFDNGYMFNDCVYQDGWICFDEHIPGKEVDYISIYSVKDQKWLVCHESYTERELNGETKLVINKDGQEIIVF